jgi:23S rRNA (adenine-N6)-dimethyltransferase
MRPNASGVHLLSCPRVIDRLVRSADLGADDLVIDFGAGPGTLTAPLAGTGSRVLAVERDPTFVRTLRRRFADRPLVRVVHADLRQVRLPGRDFTVVASIPFAVSTPLLRRLLTPAPGRLARADIVVEWGLAKRVTAARPRDLELAWWAARYDLRLVRRIPARCFTPAPAVDAAHLRIRRSTMDIRTQAILWPLLGAAYRRPAEPARRVLGDLVAHRLAGRLLRAHDTDPATPASDVHIGLWAKVASALAADRSVTVPPLPRVSQPTASRPGRGR